MFKYVYHNISTLNTEIQNIVIIFLWQYLTIKKYFLNQIKL